MKLKFILHGWENFSKLDLSKPYVVWKQTKEENPYNYPENILSIHKNYPKSNKVDLIPTQHQGWFLYKLKRVG